MQDPDRHKLDALDARLRELATAKAEAEQAQAAKRNESQAWSMGGEFVGAIVVSGGIGWWLDRHLGTGPWVMITMLVLGFAAGTLNVLRDGRKAGETETDHSGGTNIPRGAKDMKD